MFVKVPETEGGTGGSASSTKTSVYFCSILALPQFRDGNEKSAAELRWEDYQASITLIELAECYFIYLSASLCC